MNKQAAADSSDAVNDSQANENVKMISVIAQSDDKGNQQFHPTEPKRSWFATLCSCFRPTDSEFKKIEEPTVALLPPQSLKNLHKKTLVLDLDETLVHSSFQPVDQYDILIHIELQGQQYPVFVLKRPGAHEILEELAETYELVIFTASLPIYANPLLDVLDPYGYIDYRLFRDSCTPYHGALVKDLTKLGRNMKDVIIVDNSPMSFFFQPENAILSKSWMQDKTCTDLFHLIQHLQAIKGCDDVRKQLPQMNRPELYGVNLVAPLEEEEVDIGPRAEFNSPKAENEKKFDFGEEEDDREDSYSSVNID